MKVILLDEIKGKGGEGDVVEVAQGYAENFLFPKKLAVAATKATSSSSTSVATTSPSARPSVWLPPTRPRLPSRQAVTVDVKSATRASSLALLPPL